MSFNCTNSTLSMNSTMNCTMCCEDNFGTIEIAVIATVSAVALLCCPLGMFVGACLNQLVRRKRDVVRTKQAIMEEVEMDISQHFEGSQYLNPATPSKSAESETTQMQSLLKMEMIEKRLLFGGGQLTRSHSRKSLPPTPPTKRRQPVQRSNSVSYDEVDLAKVRGNRTSMELKTNQSYERMNKISTNPISVANCPLYSQPEAAKSQQDLALTHEYSEIKLKPKVVAAKGGGPREAGKLEMKSNKSYGQITVSGTDEQEPKHEYEYVDP